jgi:hypothetical protein
MLVPAVGQGGINANRPMIRDLPIQAGGEHLGVTTRRTLPATGEDR